MKNVARTRTLVLGLSLLLVVAFGASSALAAGKGKKKHRVSFNIDGASQKQLLKKGVEVDLKGKGRIKLRLESSTFDDPKWTPLADPEKARLKRRGRDEIRIDLSKAGKKRLAACGAQTIRVRGGGSKDKVELKRNTADCKPQPLDLSRADRCDLIGTQDPALCMLPFPDDFYTVDDPASATGKRINFTDASMPANKAGINIDGDPYNLNDGFSPGQTAVVRIPGIDTAADVAASKLVPLSDLGRYANKHQGVVAIDAETGERWPIWAEIDSNSDDPERTALLIHPAQNYEAGHRYILALRRLEDAEGNAIEAPEGFRYYRDDLPSKEEAINSQRDRFESIFGTLAEAGVRRSNLYMAWDFTVASNENIAGRVLHMRDDAFAQLGDTDLDNLTVEGDSPAFSVGTVDNFTLGDDARMARRVRGTVTVPCYMTLNCAAGGRFDLDADGMPVQHGTYAANFDCMIPRSAVDGTPTAARPSVYGHGLLGSAGEAVSTPQKTLGNNHNIVFCATDEIGLSGGDLINDVQVLGELGKFPTAADRLQQGLLNELYLGRAMIHPDGFSSHGAFHVDGTTGSPALLDTSRLYYNGNSQGGIMGGALTAIAPDFTRASLGVPGMNYSVLLNRSVDFDEYAEIALFPNYPDQLARPLVLSMIQMLWDRGEANGYAHVMTDNPLPNTPAHEVLMNVAFSDHQVSTWTADTQARTIGASAHSPIVDAGRWPGIDVLWDIPPIGSYPFTDSAIVYWDSGPIRDDPGSADPADVIGTEPPPLENVPNRSGEDPHGAPRRTVEEQQMVSDFLRPDAQSKITDTCGGLPCHDYLFGGTDAP